MNAAGLSARDLLFLRALAAFGAVLAAVIFFLNVKSPANGWDALRLTLVGSAAVGLLYLGWIALRLSNPSSYALAATMLKWAALVGIPAFLIGSLGPMILDPGANQGPLLGILFTGPWGATAGLLVGWVVGIRRVRR